MVPPVKSTVLDTSEFVKKDNLMLTVPTIIKGSKLDFGNVCITMNLLNSLDYTIKRMNFMMCKLCFNNKAVLLSRR